MRTLATLAILIGSARGQDSEAVLIMKQFIQKRDQVRSAAEFKTLVTSTRDQLDNFVAKAKGDDPERARAAFHASEMHLFLNDIEGAYNRFDGYVKSYPENRDYTPQARFLLGELSMQLGKDARAREKFAEFVKAEPKDPRVFGARLLSAMSYVNEAKYDEAASGLEALQKELGQTNEAWAAGVQLALCHQLAERNDDAKHALQTVIKGCTDLQMSERSKQLLTDWLVVGTPLNTFEGKDITGGAFKRPADKVMLLYFFTTTFEQAQAEVVMMKRFVDTYSAKGLAVMAVSVDKKQEEVERFAKDYGVMWQVCCDGDGFDGPIAKKLRVKTLPFVVLVDKKGIIRFMNVIYTPAGREILPAIEKLLAEK